MTRKEYLEKLENLILQRIKYHAPNLNQADVDYALLEAIGINPELPIFVFKKPLNKVFFKAFENVKKTVKFNLILLEKPCINLKKIQMLDNTHLIFKEEMGGTLFNTLEALNINYLTHSNFKNDFLQEYIKINGQKIVFDYIPYFGFKKFMAEGVVIELKQFLLNGKNTIVNLINTRDVPQNLKIEINIPLPRGYYFFNKGLNHVEIKNLTNKENAYFNFNIKNANLSFSNISGLESSTYACVNMSCQILLEPKHKRDVYFNFGENKYCIYDSKSMANFFELSQRKCNEIFDIRVQTHDVEFDNDFNFSLPRKIWEKWQKLDVDEESINNWLKLRAKIVENAEKGIRVLPSFKGLKEVKIYRNCGWKRVFVLHNNSNYIYANKTKYFNYNLLTKDIFEKNNEIYLSFAD